MYICIYVYMYICIHEPSLIELFASFVTVYIYICIYVYIYAHTCVCVGVCDVWVCGCYIYIYIYWLAAGVAVREARAKLIYLIYSISNLISSLVHLI
jgi:hypothetical protein